MDKMINRLGTGHSYKQLVKARHTKAAKIQGVYSIGLNKHVKQTAPNKINAKYGGSKFNTVMNGINVVAGAVTVGFKIYANITKINPECQAVADQVKKAAESIRKVKTSMLEVKKNVTDYNNYLNDGWSFISNQLTNANFQESLTVIQQVMKEAEPKNSVIASAAVDIGNFVNHINGSVSTNYAQTQNMVEHLNNHLQSIKFVMKCKVPTFRLFSNVSDRCKNGTDSLKNLYMQEWDSFSRLMNAEKCINDYEYITFDNLEDSIIKQAKAQKYNSDCILNNPAKKKQACR
ncbi:hypothetical protein QZH41_011420 [Actinostola sp. cb2023]|nr:hypothetical protein QZH41_011420 [Actinostola sp. cb2023]